MVRIRDRAVKWLILLSMAFLPAGVVHCDYDDDELVIDFDDWFDDGVVVDVWYDDWYDPYPCCF